MYQDVNVNVASRGEWKEPPSFPGVTTAFYEAIESAKSDILGHFNSNPSAASDTASID